MKKFYIIWNPEAPMPPTKQFTDRSHARCVARSMAVSHPGQQFFVCEAQSVGIVPNVVMTELE